MFELFRRADIIPDYPGVASVTSAVSDGGEGRQVVREKPESEDCLPFATGMLPDGTFSQAPIELGESVVDYLDRSSD